MQCSLIYHSPIGIIEIKGSERGVTDIRFADQLSDVQGEEIPPPLSECQRQLEEYFEGNRTAFDVLLDLTAYTPFYREVWRLVQSIPYGHTRSYSEIATTIGRPHASRAVGQANGHNPVPIVIPCHRVIGKDGALTGYAYGLETKHSLLALENPTRYSTQPSLF